jgi:hypothetical protein
MANWDVGTDLVAMRVVQADLGVLRETAKLPRGARIAAVPTWWSAGTGLRGKGPASEVVLKEDVRHRFDLALKVPGTQLSQQVQFRTSVVLLDLPGRPSRSHLAAWRPGSILWEDRIHLILEGSAARFPVTAASFRGAVPAAACWRLEWSPRDLSYPAMASLRLYLNRDHAEFYTAVTTRAPDATQQMMRSAFRHAVASELVGIALDNAEELADEEFEDGTVGKVLQDLISRIFPGSDLRAIAGERRKDPGRLSALVQVAMAVFTSAGREQT